MRRDIDYEDLRERTGVADYIALIGDNTPVGRKDASHGRGQPHVGAGRGQGLRAAGGHVSYTKFP